MADLERFLHEDLGRRGDITTRRLFGNKPIPAVGRLFARHRICVAGLRDAAAVFETLGCSTRGAAKEGRWVRADTTLLTIRGSAQSILQGERLALNLVGRMSGIATMTRRIVERVQAANLRCKVAATRKTTPGFRPYEKRAVVVGGGVTHRMGLFDGILIKDNHLAALGDVAEAVRRASRGSPRLPVEIEVSTLHDAQSAVRAGAQWLLIDNVPPAAARRIADAARRLNPRIRIEISGGLDPENVVHYAPFADRLSLGLLTHSAPAADVSLDVEVPKR